MPHSYDGETLTIFAVNHDAALQVLAALDIPLEQFGGDVSAYTTLLALCGDGLAKVYARPATALTPLQWDVWMAPIQVRMPVYEWARQLRLHFWAKNAQER